MQFNFLENIYWEWNIPDAIVSIVGSIIGAFLGFIFAILATKAIENEKELQKVKDVYEELYDYKNIDTIKNILTNILSIENVRLISLPLVEQIITGNFKNQFINASAYKQLKNLCLGTERVNKLFSLKNEVYFQNDYELAALELGNIDFKKDIKDIIEQSMRFNMNIEHNFVVKRYIAYCKTIYELVNDLFKNDSEIVTNILCSLNSNKKVRKSLKKVNLQKSEVIVRRKN